MNLDMTQESLNHSGGVCVGRDCPNHTTDCDVVEPNPTPRVRPSTYGLGTSRKGGNEETFSPVDS